MKKKQTYRIGEFLFRFYRKRSTSFLANIYKSGITGAPKDIHRARLDVKKILAIVDLLRIVRSKAEKDPGYDKIFKKLYRASGRIREIQVNLLLLTRPEFAAYDLTLLKLDLLQMERERTREFLDVIRKFDEHKLARIEKRIKKEVEKITPGTLQKKTNRYIQSKIALSLDLLEKGDNEKNIHEVRQHVKELSTVLSLVFTVKPSDKLELVIDGLNRSEMVIGEWHDNVVLAEAFEGFLKQQREADENQMTQIRECHQNICEANTRHIKSIIHDVRRAILSEPHL
jgi:hypothetical protein